MPEIIAISKGNLAWPGYRFGNRIVNLPLLLDLFHHVIYFIGVKIASDPFHCICSCFHCTESFYVYCGAFQS